MKIAALITLTYAFIAVATGNETCSCGLTRTRKNSKNRIVGGTSAIVNEFPLIGAITFVRDPFFIICSSTIVTKRHAITAAHCYKGPRASLAVLLGEHNIKKSTESLSYHVKIEKFIRHENYDETNNTEHDVAVLYLERELTFGQIVGPACFPDIGTTSQLVGGIVRLIGWGQLWFEGPRPSILQKVDVAVVPMSTCEKLYNGTTNGQFCTYTQDKDACQGDSGGPVLYMDRSTLRYSVVGIISYGPDDCALKDYPGVNTNVTAYSDWILGKIAETDPTSAVCPNT